ncbi:hypothetical protein HOY82DRAFT_541881 [Tuber indicum]|nr:hypothetical protein HOY82DRAFT_541881 [Tuber indicum]
MPSRGELKFGARSKFSMMLGYTSSEKIWKLWDFEGNGGRGRPVYSSDVQFIEAENAWKTSNAIMSASQETEDHLAADLDLLFQGGVVEHEEVETGSTHQSCDASPGVEASGMHNSGDLSLAETENIDNMPGSNHERREVSPEQRYLESDGGIHQSDEASPDLQIWENVGGMHMDDEASPDTTSSLEAGLGTGSIHRPFQWNWEYKISTSEYTGSQTTKRDEGLRYLNRCTKPLH